MGNSIGSLVVKLGLDAADYVAGLNKSEYQAKQFAANINQAIAKVAATIGGLQLGREFLEATKDIISSAAALNDFADATGSTVENLSRLANQAKIAGTDFDTLQSLVLKLSAGMAGADEESSKVGAALKYLGITTRDPAEALQQIAVRLQGYADGVGKVGLAVALFGKQGPAFLATLKDIAELQDVGATVSKRQAEEAENLEKAFRRLSVEASGFKNVILNDVVPALTEMIRTFSDARKFGDGFFGALGALTNSGLGFEAPEKAVVRLRGELEKLEKLKIDPGFTLFGKRFGDDLTNVEANIKTVTAALRVAEAALARATPYNGDRRNADRLVDVLNKPPVTFKPPSSGGSSKEQISEAQRYLESLQKQVDKTLELTATEQARIEIRKGLKGLTPEIEREIFALAAQADAYKELDKWIEKTNKTFREAVKIAEDQAKARADLAKQALDDADQAQKANEALRDEIAIILGGEAARKALEQDYIARAIARKEDYLASIQQKEGHELEASAVRLEIEALRERQELLKGRDFAEQLRADAEALQQVKNMLSDTLVNPLADFVSGTKSAKDAFRSFVDDLTRQLTRIATQNIANMIFGGNTSGGPDIFGFLAKMLGGFLGGGAAGGGGVPGVGFSGGGFGEHFAMGTPFAPGGLALVGEQGPELVNLPRGSRVTPNNQTRKMLGNQIMHFNVNVMPGADTRSAKQAGNMLKGVVMRAVREQ